MGELSRADTIRILVSKNPNFISWEFISGFQSKACNDQLMCVQHIPCIPYTPILRSKKLTSMPDSDSSMGGTSSGSCGLICTAPASSTSLQMVISANPCTSLTLLPRPVCHTRGFRVQGLQFCILSALWELIRDMVVFVTRAKQAQQDNACDLRQWGR